MAQLYMIRRRSAWANQEEFKRAAAIYGKVGNDEMADKLRWIRSYVIDEPDGRQRICCI